MKAHGEDDRRGDRAGAELTRCSKSGLDILVLVLVLTSGLVALVGGVRGTGQQDRCAICHRSEIRAS